MKLLLSQRETPYFTLILWIISVLPDVCYQHTWAFKHVNTRHIECRGIELVIKMSYLQFNIKYS